MQEIEIKVKGQIDRNWSNWFGGLSINYTPWGDTILTGRVRDQAELRGVLFRLADLGLELTSLNTEISENCNIRGKGGD